MAHLLKTMFVELAPSYSVDLPLRNKFRGGSKASFLNRPWQAKASRTPAKVFKGRGGYKSAVRHSSPPLTHKEGHNRILQQKSPTGQSTKQQTC